MGLTHFRRQFQVLDAPLLKKLMSTSEGIDERKVGGAHARGVKALDMDMLVIGYVPRLGTVSGSCL